MLCFVRADKGGAASTQPWDQCAWSPVGRIGAGVSFPAGGHLCCRLGSPRGFPVGRAVLRGNARAYRPSSPAGPACPPVHTFPQRGGQHASVQASSAAAGSCRGPPSFQGRRREAAKGLDCGTCRPTHPCSGRPSPGCRLWRAALPSCGSACAGRCRLGLFALCVCVRACDT